jgi:predicted dinucleotide-binding enzyme
LSKGSTAASRRLRLSSSADSEFGGNCARQFAKGGHEVKLSISRNSSRLEARAAEIGDRASVGTPRAATEFGEVVVFSVLWDSIDATLAEMGSLEGKTVIDTSNQFGSVSPPADGQTAAQHNAARMPGARYTKSFNTLTSGFQAEVADGTGDDRVVQWICGDDAEVKQAVAGLITDAGYVPVDLGGTAECAVMEAPRRPARSTARSTASPRPRTSSTRSRPAGRSPRPPAMHDERDQARLRP